MSEKYEEAVQPEPPQEALKPEVETKKENVLPMPIAVNEGQIAPKDTAELMRTIANIAAGGGFPSRFQNIQEKMAAYNMAHSLMGGRWQLALNNIAIIKGQMTIFGELPSALAEQTKEVIEKRVYCIDKDYNEICVKNKNINAEPWAGVCQIQRKGRQLKEFTYTMDEATKAGQYPPKRRDGSINEDSPWFKFKKVMLMRKAMGLGVKFEFADAMVGVPVAEYDFDLAPDIKDVTPVIDKASELNSRFSQGGNSGGGNTL